MWNKIARIIERAQWQAELERSKLFKPLKKILYIFNRLLWNKIALKAERAKWEDGKLFKA